MAYHDSSSLIFAPFDPFKIEMVASFIDARLGRLGIQLVLQALMRFVTLTCVEGTFLLRFTKGLV